jgi:hypothetical protein
MKPETSSTLLSRTASASGPRRADTPIGARTVGPSRSPVGASSSSRISARSRWKPPRLLGLSLDQE